MAAERAVIIQLTIKSNLYTEKVSGACFMPRQNPIHANGNANMLWLKVTNFENKRML